MSPGTAMPNLRIDGSARFEFRFPELDARANYQVTISRTLRYPPVAAGFPWRRRPRTEGGFALRPVDDFAGRLPAIMLDRGGVLVPLWQSEGLRISAGRLGYRHAVRVLAGEIDAVTGEPPLADLSAKPRNFITAAPLDGIATPEGESLQFTAPRPRPDLPLAQRLGLSARTALRVSVHPQRVPRPGSPGSVSVLHLGRPVMQPIIPPRDTIHGLVPADWPNEGINTLFLILVDASTWRELTGDWPSHRPLMPPDYAGTGLPRLADYDEPGISPEGLVQLQVRSMQRIDPKTGWDPAVELTVRLAEARAFPL